MAEKEKSKEAITLIEQYATNIYSRCEHMIVAPPDVPTDPAFHKIQQWAEQIKEQLKKLQ